MIAENTHKYPLLLNHKNKSHFQNPFGSRFRWITKADSSRPNDRRSSSTSHKNIEIRC
jgi:hypothetical protein